MLVLYRCRRVGKKCQASIIALTCIRKKGEVHDWKSRKEKKNIEDQIEDVSLKRRKLRQSIKVDVHCCEKLSTETELKDDFSLLNMAISFKDVIKNNKGELKKLYQGENGIRSD